jgi:hypothetical protein
MNTKLLLLFLLLSCFGLPLQAQGDEPGQSIAHEWAQKAKSQMLTRNYAKAERFFRKALEKDSDYSEALHGLALALSLQERYNEASVYADQLLEMVPHYSRLFYFQAAEMHYLSGHYQRSQTLFEEFVTLQSVPDHLFGIYGELEQSDEQLRLEEVPRRLAACQVAMDSLLFNQVGEVVQLGDGVNSAADEYFPVLSADQQLLYFTSRENPFSDEDLFVSSQDAGNWGPSKPYAPALRTPQNEGMCTFVRNQRRIFFTACGRSEVAGTCDLWEASIKGSSVRAIGEPAGELNSDAWESQASISCDGRRIYFASNRAGGEGGTDIWRSDLQSDGTWGTPVNLGVPINTPGDEEAPFITNDGHTLFFSSDGHPGLGEQDIFIARTLDNGTWGTPTNLGMPVNSSYRELGCFITADGKQGFFASNREGGYGGMDIYSFQLPVQLSSDPITYVEVQVIDSLSGSPLPATVFSKEQGTIQTDEEGRFFRCLPADSTLTMTLLETDYHAYYRKLQIPLWDNRSPYSFVVRLSLKELPESTPPLQGPGLSNRTHPSSKSVIEYTSSHHFNQSRLEPEVIRNLQAFVAEELRGEVIHSVATCLQIYPKRSGLGKLARSRWVCQQGEKRKRSLSFGP